MGGGTDVYQSDKDPGVDNYISSLISGWLTGQSVGDDPNFIGNRVAQTVGGSYDTKSGTVTAQGGAKYRVNPDGSVTPMGGGGLPGDAKDYQDASGKKFNNMSDVYTALYNNQLFGQDGKQVDASKFNGPGQWDEQVFRAVDEAKTANADPNSPWNAMASNFQQKYYDPNTGAFTSTDPSTSKKTAEDYFQQYGGYLDQGYTPQNYQKYEYSANPSYQQFDYKPQEVKSIAPVIDSAWDTKYNMLARDTEARGRDQRQEIDDFTAKQGGSLNSGRRLGLQKDLARDQDRTLGEYRSGVEADKAFAKRDDAVAVRDKNADYGWQAQKLRGDESRYGQDWANKEHAQQQKVAQDENLFGQEWARDEAKYGFEDNQKRGAAKLGMAEGMDTQMYNRANQERSMQQQNMGNMIGYLQDLLKIYGGQDATAVQRDAAQAQAIGSAFGGLTSAAATVAKA